MSLLRCVCVSILISIFPTTAWAQDGAGDGGDGDDGSATTPTPTLQISPELDDRLKNIDDKLARLKISEDSEEKRKLEEAEEVAKDATEKAAVLEEQLEDQKIRNQALELYESTGVNVGAAFVINTPTVAKWKQENQVGVGFMPYAFFAPAYWIGNKHETNIYCANRYKLSSRDEIHKIAKKYSYDSATVYMESNLLPASKHEELRLLAPELFDNNSQLTTQQIFTDVQIVKTGSGDAKKQARERLLNYVSREVNDWDPAVSSGGCFSRSLGLFVGVPVLRDPFTKTVSTTTTVTTEDGDATGTVETEFETKPLVAFGGAFSPHKNVAFLAGFTINDRAGDAEGGIARVGVMAGVALQTEVLNWLFGGE